MSKVLSPRSNGSGVIAGWVIGSQPYKGRHYWALPNVEVSPAVWAETFAGSGLGWGGFEDVAVGAGPGEFFVGAEIGFGKAFAAIARRELMHVVYGVGSVAGAGRTPMLLLDGVV